MICVKRNRSKLKYKKDIYIILHASGIISFSLLFLKHKFNFRKIFWETTTNFKWNSYEYSISWFGKYCFLYHLHFNCYMSFINLVEIHLQPVNILFDLYTKINFSSEQLTTISDLFTQNFSLLCKSHVCHIEKKTLNKDMTYWKPQQTSQCKYTGS